MTMMMMMMMGARKWKRVHVAIAREWSNPVVAMVLHVNASHSTPVGSTVRWCSHHYATSIVSAALQKRQGRVESSECTSTSASTNCSAKQAQGWIQWMQGSPSYSGASVRPSLHASSCFFLSTSIQLIIVLVIILVIVLVIIIEALFFCHQIFKLLESQYIMSHKCPEPVRSDFWIQYVRSLHCKVRARTGPMCRPPWLNSNRTSHRTSHLPKIGPPRFRLPGNGHFLISSQQFHRRRKQEERHNFHLHTFRDCD